jgi:hypothetical protein
MVERKRPFIWRYYERGIKQMNEAIYKKYKEVITNRKLNVDILPEGLFYKGKNIGDCNHFDIESLFNICGVDYQHCVDSLLEQMLNTSFPYPSIDKKKIIEDWQRLLQGEGTGKRIIEYFFKEVIYSASVGKHMSPLEAWRDPYILRKTIENRIIYDKYGLSPRHILKGFSVMKTSPKVSVFSPSLAISLLKKYSPYDKIFDPFMGFGGRLLGVVALNKRYTGWDINEEHIRCSLNMISALSLSNAKVEIKNSFNNAFSSDCLFTCPPYNLKEVWGENQLDLSCDEWISICLQNFKCQQYIFVVDKTIEFKDNIVEELENKSHFGKNTEKVVVVTRA